MNRLTRLVLKRPVTTLLAVLALVVFGFSSLTTLRLELMPDMEMPMKIVYTVYPGADSESVDDLVTTPIEDKVGSLSGVKSITSSSMENVLYILSLLFFYLVVGNCSENASDDGKSERQSCRNY